MSIIMNDQQFLAWIYHRLEHMHKEDPRGDHMRRLRSIFEHTPEQGSGTAPITTREVIEIVERQERLDKILDDLLATGLDEYIADAISTHESQFHNEA